MHGFSSMYVMMLTIIDYYLLCGVELEVHRHRFVLPKTAICDESICVPRGGGGQVEYRKTKVRKTTTTRITARAITAIALACTVL